MAIQDRLRVFHDYADCRGIIVSTDQEGETTLKCAECGKKVGKLDARLLNQLIEQIPKPKEPNDFAIGHFDDAIEDFSNLLRQACATGDRRREHSSGTVGAGMGDGRVL